ncbi:MAG: heme ABC transporter permease [Legionellales bacterium]|nr:MAG: heme ABC transporter permease [Legionellales bacterium]
MQQLNFLLNTKNIYSFSGKLLPWLAALCGVGLLYGITMGLFVVPADYQQGDAFRIIYVHVPAAILSLLIYAVMGISAAIYLIYRIKILDIIAQCSAPIGASFTLLALVTGSIWGKPMWGTWWVWDARLTSELILLFLYFGYMGLRSATDNYTLAAKLSAILAIAGLIDLPIIHFSVNWWHTLHQGATISKFAAPSISDSMLSPLLVMISALGLFYVTMLIIRMRGVILSREADTIWVCEELR